MPSFSLDILFGQMLLVNAFLAPEIVGIVAGIPAFVIAASTRPFDPSRRWLPFGSAGLAATAIALALILRSDWSAPLLCVGVLGAGALVGFLVRTIDLVRRFWLPIGLAAALAVGAAVFMFGHYGQNNCAI